MEHLDSETLCAYVAQNLAEEDAFAADCHLGTCPDCARRVKAHYALKGNFDALWDSWTAREHGRELAQSRIEEAMRMALAAAEQTRPDLAGRIGGWFSAFGKKTAAAFTVSLDSARQKAEILGQQLAEAAVLDFIPAPAGITGAEQFPAAITVETRQGPHIEVTADLAARAVSVCAAMPGHKPWPLVFLIPKAGGPAIIREFHRPLETETLLAEFEDVADGEYLLLLEGDPGHEANAS